MKARHIEKRRNKLYAMLDIPKPLRPIIGRRRFIATLGTDSLSLAQPRADKLVAEWRKQITAAKAKAGTLTASDAEAIRPELADAVFWSKYLRRADLTDAEREVAQEHVADLAREMVYASAPAGDIGQDGPDAWEALPGQKTRAEFLHTVASLTTDHYIEDWLASLHATLKTVAGRRRHANALASKFPLVSDLRPREVKLWCIEQLEAGKALSSITRLLSDCNMYWVWLIDHGHVEQDTRSPFTGLKLASNAAAKANGRRPKPCAFPLDRVLSLVHAATLEGDHALADLIMLGAYTGARISELCHLRCEDVERLGQDTYTLHIRDAKTEAGDRSLPLHSELVELVERLLRDSQDGFLLTGLNVNTYGARTSSLSSRFSRLKTEEGWSERYGFHSLRRSFITALRQAGVPEQLAAAVAGHSTKGLTMSYGLYGRKESDEKLRETVELVRYFTGRTAGRQRLSHTD